MYSVQQAEGLSVLYDLKNILFHTLPGTIALDPQIERIRWRTCVQC